MKTPPQCPTCGYTILARYPRNPEFYRKLAMDPYAMGVDIVELQRMDMACQHRIDEDITRRAEFKTRILPDIHRHMVVEMRLSIYGKTHPDAHVIRFPADWWQALKERFAPAWFRDRYPVKFTTYTASLKELYPDLDPALPDKSPVMRFHVKSSTSDSYDW